ncbi:hypothetical protein [Edaphobacter aggregans]|uniref:hypothetical protein n=1 Tax=Edaphobacter aggregans TaxID=570835 RepID=UPI0012F84CAA|nr:hypothetical protein [Edaphobacter aggregans]
MAPAIRGGQVNSTVMKFLNVSIASLIVGAGLGFVAAWCMTARLDRQYQMTITEGASALGAAVGMLLGWVAYYGIFKQKVRYETFCAVVALTTVTTAVTAYVLHILTDTGGWLSVFVAIAVFLAASFTLRHS